MDCAKVTVALLAAGGGTRFGGNKLEAMLGGRMLGIHVADTLAGLKCGTLLAVHDPVHVQLASALHGAGYVLVENRDRASGLSHSIALAATAALATDADDLLVCLADMPFVTAAHLHHVIAARGPHVVTSAAYSTAMPPALFPRSYWLDLARLRGDTGARHLLKGAVRIQGDADMLADIDTRADLYGWL